jgi:DNA-directed RNA polymerase subunit K
MTEEEEFYDDIIDDDIDDIDDEENKVNIEEYEEEEEGKEEDLDSESENELDDIIDDLSEVKITDVKVKKNKINDIYKNISKYEMTRIIGFRAQQISQNSDIYIDLPNNVIDPIEIAILEYNAVKIPITTIRSYHSDKSGEFYETINSIDSLIRFNPLY